MSEQPIAEQQAKVNALRAVADKFDSDFTMLVSRDENGRLLDLAVLAKGTDARELLAWIKRREKKRK